MKTTKLTIMAVAVTLLSASAANLIAEDADKEITIKGSMVCGKCTLHETKKCQDVVQVTKDGKTVNYYLKENEISKKAHEPICDADSSEKVTVTGTVKEKNGKEIMIPSKIEVDKS